MAGGGAPDPARLEALFDEALALPEAVRAAFLDAACAGEPALRDELAALLAALPAARRLFEGAPHLAIGVSAADAPDADPAIGQTVGAYRLLERIGTGGMGSVYRGERVDAAFRKQVAVKLVRPGLDSAEIVERFRRERQVLADLEHPHIARLIDGGSTPDGRPYLVMEFVDGLPIDAHADAARLDLRARLALFLTVCAAVQVAHRNLVIHRDLKPSNILVDREGQVKLLDFGIAKVLESEGGDGEHTLLPALTPRYASPEQVAGRRVTTATDIYSLGVLLYELLAGARPYALPAQFTPEAVRVICEREPTRPSRAAAATSAETAAGRGLSPARLAHALNGDLDTILLKALRKEPERRYASVDELAADIRRHLDGLPVLAAPDRLGYRARKFLRRHRALSIATAGTLLVLVAALVVSLGAYRRAAQQTREAERLAYSGSLAAAEAAIRQNEVGEARARLAAAPVALRGWEWRHLSARLDRSRFSVAAHEAGITRLRLAPDGGRVVTASVDGSIREWDAASGAARRQWGPFGASVESIALAPTDGGLVAGLGDGRVLLLDAAEGTAPCVLDEGGQWAVAAFSPDGRRVAAGKLDGRLRVWDRATGALLASWQAHGDFAILAWSPAGDRLVTAGGDGSLRIWALPSGRLLRELTPHARRAYSLAVSPDGRLVASGSMDRSAAVHDAESGERLCVFLEHRGTVSDLAFTADSRALISCSPDGRLLRWEARTGRLLAELRGHEADVSAVAASADGRTLATGDWGGVLRLWDAAATDVSVLRAPHLSSLVPQLATAALDPAGRWVACALNLGVLPIWPLGEGESPPRVIESLPTFTVLAIASDGHRLFAGGEGGELITLDTADWRTRGQVQAHRGSLLALAVHPTGRWLATAGDDSLVQLWELSAGELPTGPARALAGHRGAVYDLEFSPDGALLVSCGADSSLRFWDWRQGREQMPPRATGAALHDLAIHPGGRRLAVADSRGQLSFLSLPDGRPEATGVTPRAVALAWSQDGSRLAAASNDGVLRILDAVSLRELVGLRGHLGRVNALVFGSGDACLVSSSRDGTLRVWDAPPAPR